MISRLLIQWLSRWWYPYLPLGIQVMKEVGMNKLISRVLDMINFKGSEWLNKKTLLSSEESELELRIVNLHRSAF